MIKFFKREKKFSKEKESWWLNINLYWKLTVSFMFAVIIFSSFFGYYFFMKINKESVLETGDTIRRSEIVKLERIEKVLEYFYSRKQKSSQIINSPSPIIDPSL